MRLSSEALESADWWRQRGYQLPKFDREKMIETTRKHPKWVHFGSGNLFRAFPAMVQQALLERGVEDSGIIVCGTYDEQVIKLAYEPYDNLSIVAVLEASGTVEKHILGSIAEAWVVREHWSDLKAVFANPELQMSSFTITEKGYNLWDEQGILLFDYQSEITGMDQIPKTLMLQVASLLYHRFRIGAFPIAMVSMDNCSHNGDILKRAIVQIASYWQEWGIVEPEFLDYLTDGRVSFPWSMIDKITPRPDAKVLELLMQDGLEGCELQKTEKGSYCSCFVNAEQAQYLIIEDDFPNGHPALEQCGVILTRRDTVERVEMMKVGTCLNPIHTALAIFGCLLSFHTIYEEMADDLLVRLVQRLGYIEGMPVVVNSGIIDPREFLREVLETRLPNPFIPDTPQRIVTDTSQKLSVRFGNTVKAYLQQMPDQLNELICIPLIYAGWLRYLMGMDDDGNMISLSPDPMLEQLTGIMKDISFGDPIEQIRKVIMPVLSSETIFGVNLYTCGIASKVESYLFSMTRGQGAVRSTLEHALKQ